METSIATNIKIDLLRVGASQSEIARGISVSVSSVNDVISGKRRNPRIRAAIALAINKPVSEIWPDAKPEEQAA